MMIVERSKHVLLQTELKVVLHFLKHKLRFSRVTCLGEQNVSK